ncbi:unnamed protein product [Leuciscus chuanchicus]
MENYESNFTLNATASGAADAPALGNLDAGEKYATGRRNQRKIVTPKMEIRIAAWNVRTGHHVGQKEIIAKELLSCKIDIAALSEVRLTGSGQMVVEPPSIDDQMTLYYSGGDKREAGVGFMVARRIVGSVVSFQPISDRLAVLTINGTTKTHLVAVYAPTETNPEPTKNDFYNQLQLTLDSELIILAGDFNAHIGTDRSGWENTMGCFGHGVINDNGLRLLSFASANSYIIGNSYFQHPKKHQFTWRNPAGNDSAMLDYILINSRFRSSLKDVRSMRGPDCGSDHYLVRAVIKLRLHRTKSKSRSSAKLDWKCLLDPVRKTEFQIALSNRFAALAPSEDVNVEEQQLSNAIMKCAKELCPPARRRTQPWISDECLGMVDERKRVKLVDFERYRQLNKDIRCQMKEEREAYWNQIAADLEVAASKHEYHTLYRTLRRLSGKAKSTNDNIRKAEGTFVRSSTERLQRWREFFETLYNHDPPQGTPAEPPQIEPPEAAMSDAEPTLVEKHREQTGREEQSGFRPQRGCCDQIFSLRQVMEERIRCGKRTVIVFIDFRSAFDCTTLETEHIPSKVIKLLQENYNGSSSQIRIRNELSAELTIRTGVRQGDVASPLLVNIVVDAIMRKVFEGRRGVQFDENGSSVTDLMFADDSGVLAEDDAEATDILYEIASVAQSYGLKINVDKTKVLTTDGSPADVNLDGIQIEQVQKFKYLGSLVEERRVASMAETYS